MKELWQLYIYIAKGSVHKGHTIEVKSWKRGKVLAYCRDCHYHFYGIRRCVRRVRGDDEKMGKL